MKNQLPVRPAWLLAFPTILCGLAACSSSHVDGPVTDRVDAGTLEGGGEGPCSAPGQPCCPAFGCNSQLACVGGVCVATGDSSVGSPCTGSSDCSAGICVDVGQPPGGPEAWTGSVCSRLCSVGSDCPSNWHCGADGLCGCTYAPEVCDGLDNDCDAVADNEPQVDADCARRNGPGYVCVAAACVCPSGWTLCGTSCVDTTKDLDHCGGCDTACAAECLNGTCAKADAIAAGPTLCALFAGAVACVGSPADLASGVAIAGGFSNACAISSSGDVQCWGDLRYGEAGNGAAGGYVWPLPASDAPPPPLVSGVTALAIGEYTTCARSCRTRRSRAGARTPTAKWAMDPSSDRTPARSPTPGAGATRPHVP